MGGGIFDIFLCMRLDDLGFEFLHAWFLECKASERACGRCGRGYLFLPWDERFEWDLSLRG